MITDQIAAEQQPSLPDAEPLPADSAAIGAGVTDLEQQARAFVRQRPVVAVLAAAGVGYLVARLVSRVLR